MKKILTLFAAVVCGIAVQAKTLYLNPGSGDNNWAKDGAVLFVHSWDAQDNDAQFTGSGELLSAEIPDGNNHIKIVRMPAGSTSLNWDTKWNETGDLEIPAGMNKYTITGWGLTDGTWSNEGGTQPGGDTPGGQGGGTPGGQGGGSDDDVNYYAMGWINGTDHGEAAYDKFEDEYMFVDGKLAIDCRMGSYIAIKDHLGNFYYSRTQTTIANESVTMEWANGWTGGQKWAIPEGVNYIIIRNAAFKDKIQLERVDKATFDAYSWGNKDQGVEETKVSEKARKVFVDGQLRIIRGDKIFDVTGREL